MITTAVDQRLNVWQVDREEEEEGNGALKLMSSHTHDVADPSSLRAYSTRSAAP